MDEAAARGKSRLRLGDAGFVEILRQGGEEFSVEAARDTEGLGVCTKRDGVTDMHSDNKGLAVDLRDQRRPGQSLSGPAFMDQQTGICEGSRRLADMTGRTVDGAYQQ